ncbi:hypothetical protein CTAYLR_003648 [Chrysophaeum taylorii]|uniref:Polymerase nucleotidyl transferase domain-containing protein n=1 Tax=Chrysophaeum taylorii TaxID=2483200 RepID=A0AAD7UDC3_9STRA|nr:hypothetical protein CTAYLR_003648 [Chrysophaeum taylorii]
MSDDERAPTGWRGPMEALARWTYQMYPKTTGARSSTAKESMVAWWRELSAEDKREALTTEDAGVIALAGALFREGLWRFELETCWRRASGAPPRFRRRGRATAGVASRLLVSSTVVRWDARCCDARRLFAPSLREESGDEWRVARDGDAPGERRLEILAIGDSVSLALETIDEVTGGRAFSTAAAPGSADDPWCRLPWFKAEQARGVTLAHLLANVAEGLAWRKFWHDHRMSRRPRPRRSPRASPDVDAALDGWWFGLTPAARRNALWRALAAQALATAGRRDRGRGSNSVEALRTLAACLETASAVALELARGACAPSSLAKSPLGAPTIVAWFRAAIRLGLEDERCRENCAALLDAEDRSSKNNHALVDSPCPIKAAKPKKRRGKKANKEPPAAAPSMMPPRRSEERSDRDEAAATIARRWRRYSSSDHEGRRCRSASARDVEPRLRRSSTAPCASIDAASEQQRSCPPSPSRRRTYESNDLGAGVGGERGSWCHIDDDDDARATSWQRVASPVVANHPPSSSSSSSKGKDAPPALERASNDAAVVSRSASSRGKKTASSSSSSRGRQTTPGPGAAATTKKKPSSAPKGLCLNHQPKPRALDLTKTAEETTSYSDALRKNMTIPEAARAEPPPVVVPAAWRRGCEPQRPLELAPPRGAAPSDSRIVDEPVFVADGAREGDDNDDVVWRLTRANLSLRRDNLKLQAEVSRLYSEVAAHRGGGSSLPSYLGSETVPPGTPVVAPPPMYGDATASVSSETHLKPRCQCGPPAHRLRASTTVDDGGPFLRGGGARQLFPLPPLSSPPSCSKRAVRGVDAAAGETQKPPPPPPPPPPQRVLQHVNAPFGQPPLRHPPNVGAGFYAYYYCENHSTGFLDVASDDGRMTIRSDTSPAVYPPHQHKPLEAVRECAVLVPASSGNDPRLSRPRPPPPPPGTPVARPPMAIDSGSRGSSFCDTLHGRIVTDSIDDLLGSSDEFSQSSSSDEENDDDDDDDDDEKWATTTTRGSGKPPSLARANLSLDDELPYDLLSASSHSSLALSPRGGAAADATGANEDPVPVSAMRRAPSRHNSNNKGAAAACAPAATTTSLQSSSRDAPRAQATAEPSRPATAPPPETARPHRRVRKRVVVDESLFSTSSRLADDVRAFAESISRRQRSRESAWRAARERVRDVAKSLWPRARVETYGSCVTRLSLADAASDLDLVVRLPRVRVATPAMTPGDLEGRNAIKETWPQELARRLRSEAWVEQSSVRTIASAFVPIVKLVTMPLGETREAVRLDVSFEGPWHRGLDANRLVLKMLDDMPAARPLLLVLKQHAAERGLCASYTGGLSSYALALLVVRYLHEQPRNDLDPGALLLGFFDFYAHRFEARKTGISVGRACFFARAELGSRHYAAATGYAMGNNHDGATRAAHMARSFHFDPLYVEDPLSPGNNVGRNCFRIAQIQRAWSDAFFSLSDAVAKGCRPLYRGGGIDHRRPNLLSAIISIAPPIINTPDTSPP